METTTLVNPSRVKRTITTLTPNLGYADWLCAAASAVLLALCFPPFEQSYLIFIALVPALWRARVNNTKHNLFLGLATGFIYNLILLHWLIYVTGPGMFLLAFVAGAPLMFPFWVWGALIGRWYRIPAFALSWCLVEYLRSIGPFAFSWGFVGHATYDFGVFFLNSIEWLGILGASFLFVSFNASLFSLLHRFYCWVRDRTLPKRIRNEFKPALIYFVIISFLIFWNATLSVGTSAMHSKFHRQDIVNLRVALIQGSFPQDAKESASVDEMLSRYLDLSRQAMAENPDLIIWPESTVPYPLNLWEDGLHQIVSFVKENDVELLLGSVHAELLSDDKVAYYNRALHFRPDKIRADDPTEMILRNVNSYDKMHLVPYGEWIPGGQYWPFYYIETLIEEAGAGIFQPGREQTIFETRKGYRFAVMICFESTLSWQAHSAKEKGVDFLVNITNDAWFKRSAGLRQHFIQSQFRAVEARVPLLRAANTGITGRISPTGGFEAIADNTPGYYIAKLGLGALDTDSKGSNSIE
ncbi:MAG: apolipoprotein N-acyltransferase [Candidatus Hinthialibacter antarcticus]|nr:apolipoprotein N-acyltransferase [Candidatus Hinthialibacter antarcticus]